VFQTTVTECEVSSWRYGPRVSVAGHARDATRKRPPPTAHAAVALDRSTEDRGADVRPLRAAVKTSCRTARAKHGVRIVTVSVATASHARGDEAPAALSTAGGLLV
jgi:hypothetical protein